MTIPKHKIAIGTLRKIAPFCIPAPSHRQKFVKDQRCCPLLLDNTSCLTLCQKLRRISLNNAHLYRCNPLKALSTILHYFVPEPYLILTPLPSAPSSRMSSVHRWKRKDPPGCQLSMDTPLGVPLRQYHELPQRDFTQADVRPWVKVAYRYTSRGLGLQAPTRSFKKKISGDIWKDRATKI